MIGLFNGGGLFGGLTSGAYTTSNVYAPRHDGSYAAQARVRKVMREHAERLAEAQYRRAWDEAMFPPHDRRPDDIEAEYEVL